MHDTDVAHQPARGPGHLRITAICTRPGATPTPAARSGCHLVCTKLKVVGPWTSWGHTRTDRVAPQEGLVYILACRLGSSLACSERL